MSTTLQKDSTSRSIRGSRLLDELARLNEISRSTPIGPAPEGYSQEKWSAKIMAIRHGRNVELVAMHRQR